MNNSHSRVDLVSVMVCFLIILKADLKSQTYTGPNPGSWNNSANWTPSTVPNAPSAAVTFSPAAALQVYADDLAATNITFGNLSTTTNQNVILGGVTPSDLGSFTIDGGPGGATWDVSSSLISGRGIFLHGNKLDHFTLNSDLTVNLNAGPNTGRLLGIRQATAMGPNRALNGNGRTITLNGGSLELGFTGVNGRPAGNVTFDLRNAEDLALRTLGNFSLPSDVNFLIGNTGTQRAHISGNLTSSSNKLLHGDFIFQGFAGNRTFNLDGVISDASGTNRVTYFSTGTSGMNVNIAGTLGPNTYAGGTTIDLSGTGGNRTVTATKTGALGTGDVDLLAGRLTLGGNQTVAGLSGNIGTEVTGNSTITTRILTLNQSSGTFTYDGQIGFNTADLNNIAIVKEAAGIQILTGSNTYTGGTTVNGGTLLVNNTTGSGTGTGSVTVNSGAQIGGDGSISGSLTLNAGARFVFDPSFTLDVSGVVTIDNSFGISSLVDVNGAAINWASILDNTYTLINTTSSVSNISNFGIANQVSIGIDRFAYFQNGLELVVYTIPEPGAVALYLLGGVLLFLLFRFRSRSHNPYVSPY